MLHTTGAGAAGSSTAYHLAKYVRRLTQEEGSLGSDPERPTFNVSISVFEKSSYVGGRTQTVNAYRDPSEPVEVGASIFVPANKILSAAAEEFGFDVGSLTEGRQKGLRGKGGGETATASAAPEFGIWNGQEFVYIHEGRNQWWDLSKMIWRYGLLAPMRTDKLVKATVNQFLRLYEEWQPFQTLTDAAALLGLTRLTSQTGRELLESHNIGDKFANEIVQAATRVNYAQNISFIHGLETMVSMAGAGAMSVAGGNWRIFAKMLEIASAEVNLDSDVRKVERTASKSWELEIHQRGVDGSLNTRSEAFDTVVIASPFQFTDLKIRPTPLHVPAPVPYVKLYVKLFTSPYELSASAFGLPWDASVPDTILTTLSPPSSSSDDQCPLNGDGSKLSDKVGFFSLSKLRTIYNPRLHQKEYLYKLFSPTMNGFGYTCHFFGFPIGSDIDSSSCGQNHSVVTWSYQRSWNSYPYEYPRTEFEPHSLDGDLWYTGGMDNFISTMETNALMGRKVASDIVDQWTGKHESDV